MATYTENYNLKMPSGQDAPDVEDFNTNAEIIDTVLKAHSDNTADEYSPDETYTAGRLVINNNALWKAKQDIDVAEAWTPDHWELTTLAAELSAVNSRISNLDSRMGLWAMNKYVVGQNFNFQSVFTDPSSTGSRQTVLMFGNANGQLVNGALLIRGDGSECAWSGNPSSISASMDSSGRVTVNLGRQAYDTFTLISGGKIAL